MSAIALITTVALRRRAFVRMATWKMAHSDCYVQQWIFFSDESSHWIGIILVPEFLTWLMTDKTTHCRNRRCKTSAPWPSVC